MGAVYEAVQEPLGRRVALKVLHREYASDAEVLARFFNEARAVNLVAHPALVQISEFNQDSEGMAYLVMEYLSGQTLSGRLHEYPGGLAVEEVLHIAWQVADVLAAVHDHGIVHRDLKPSNVMLVPDPAMPGGSRVKLLDFGIAKLLGDNASADGPRTRTGLPMGTPRYMSPEQCRGASSVDSQSDVYSLGVMCYELLAGRPPFDAQEYAGMIGMHLFQKPPPLSKAASQVGGALAALIHRMLEKDKDARPTMRQVAEAMKRLLDDPKAGNLSILPRLHLIPFSADKNPTANRGEVLSRLNPRGRGLLWGGAASILLMTGVILWSRHTGKGSPQPVKATPAAPRLVPVRFTLTSVPPGALVIRAMDQVVLGTTPWQYEQAPGSGQIELYLRYPGFAERKLSFDASRSSAQHAELTPEAAAPAKTPEADQKKSVPRAATPTAAAAPRTSAQGNQKVPGHRGPSQNHAKTRVIDD